MTDILTISPTNGVVPHEPQDRPDLGQLLETFGAFVDQRAGAIGRVVGSEREPSGSPRLKRLSSV